MDMAIGMLRRGFKLSSTAHEITWNKKPTTGLWVWIVRDNAVKFHDPRLNHYPEIQLYAVSDSILAIFHENFIMEVASDVISNMAED